MAFNIFCRAAVANEPITVYGDGRQTRDFTYVSDIVRATRAAASRPRVEGRTFNVGGGSRVSVRTTLQIIEECVDRPLDVHFADAQLGDVRDTGAHTAAAREQLDFTPAVSLQEGLHAQFDWAVSRAYTYP
jgi:UDP-glucose 4-epimerase